MITLSQNSIQKILGINEKVYLTKEDMSKQFIVTFSPYSDNKSLNINKFEKKLRESFSRLNIKVVPYDDSWVDVPLKKRINRFSKYLFNNVIWYIRKITGMSEINFYLPLETIKILSGSKRIKKGICVVCFGEHSLKQLQMQHISSFKDNSIVTIVDFPEEINESSTFNQHFDVAMKLFAYHMTNIVISVDDKKMMVYNFNASHPIYTLDDDKFDCHILETLIPKVVAPISPHRLREFKILKDGFNPNDNLHSKVIKELAEGARMFAKTNLYPSGKKIDDLPFRHNLHKLIGKLHLDNRSGMSFGFLAYQMPFNLSEVYSIDEFRVMYQDSFVSGDYYVNEIGKIYILVNIDNKEIVLEVPEVWVMTLRSGSDKTNFNPAKDLIKLGLVGGTMYMQYPSGLKISSEYKPSFDTKVILAHAVGNVMIASILDYFDKNNKFSNNSKKNGLSISHWHGYFHPKQIPHGLTMYGLSNPHVSCSSPQSAVYALSGKLVAFFDYFKHNKHDEYIGDIHIEPHHGINVSYPSLTELAEYILNNPDSTVLGNKYLNN